MPNGSFEMLYRFDKRGDLTVLSITTTKADDKASKDKLSRWVKAVKGMLKGTCIGMKIFYSHSTRSASTSMGKSLHLPIDLVLEARGWRSMKSLYAKRYDKPIEENKFAKAILQYVNVKCL